MFEKASRLKIRFESIIGGLTTEDLWQLPLKGNINKANLNDIAIHIYREIKKTESLEVSFVDDKPADTSLLELRLAIVKHIIAVKKHEAIIAANAKKFNDERQFLLSLLEQKQKESIMALSAEEIQVKLDGLGKESTAPTESVTE